MHGRWLWWKYKITFNCVSQDVSFAFKVYFLEIFTDQRPCQWKRSMSFNLSSRLGCCWLLKTSYVKHKCRLCSFASKSCAFIFSSRLYVESGSIHTMWNVGKAFNDLPPKTSFAIDVLFQARKIQRLYTISQDTKCFIFSSTHTYFITFDLVLGIEDNYIDNSSKRGNIFHFLPFLTTHVSFVYISF